MIIRKIICLLFAVLLVRSGIAQENPYDNAIGEAISRSDWFETRARYEQSADSLSDYMRLFSGALLDHNFNNPAGAVEKIQHMYDEYNAQMGGNFFSLFWMMSDNLAKLGHFKAAHDICTSLLAQGRDYMDGDADCFRDQCRPFRAEIPVAPYGYIGCRRELRHTVRRRRRTNQIHGRPRHATNRSDARLRRSDDDHR